MARSSTHAMAPRQSYIRFQVDPRSVPPDKAARRMGLGLPAFNLVLPELHARGFPQPDPTTGHYDLRAIDAWLDVQSGLAPQATALTGSISARDAASVFSERARALNGQ